jgi:hypothetical protein
VLPVRYELGSYTLEDGILHSHRRENLKAYKTYVSCIKITYWTYPYKWAVKRSAPGDVKVTDGCTITSDIATDTVIKQEHGVTTLRTSAYKVPCSEHLSTIPGVFLFFLSLAREMVGYNVDYIGQERFLPN